MSTPSKEKTEKNPEIAYEKYYQLQTVWEDDHNNRFKVVFGYFEDEEKMGGFLENTSLMWNKGRFFICNQSDHLRSELILNKDISYLDGSNIEDIENLYPELVPDINDSCSWHEINRTKFLTIIDVKIIEHHKKLDINQAYKEVWRLLFSVLENLGEAIKYNGELEVIGSPLDNSFRIWKTAAKLMEGEAFESSEKHNERIEKTYKLLRTIFKDIDHTDVFKTVKYGQSLTFSRLTKDKNQTDSMVNGQYVFK